MLSDSYRDLVYKDAREQAEIIAELQQLFQRSLEQIRYQASLLNNVRDAVVVWDLRGEIAYVNPAAQALFGRSKEIWLSMPAEAYMNLFTPAVTVPGGEGTGGLRIERFFTSQGNKIVWVSSHVYALRDQSASGKLIGYMDVCRDITERKDMEARVQEAQLQLIQATRLAAIGELASGIAHHINNPLTTIIAESQLLLQSLPEYHPGRDSAKAIDEAGWRVQRAVQQLLDFSQPPSNTLETLDVNDTIQYALELVGDQIRAQDVEMVIDLSHDLPYLRGNPRQLVDLWVNLLMLAHGATSDGQSHTIQICSKAPSRRSILVEISDDGQPVPSAEMATLFEPGFLKDLGRRGTGIELTLCQEIVRQHRGQITAESDPKDVTIFRVLLPAET
jgi:PAS domain S-box-containing protein